MGALEITKKSRLSGSKTLANRSSNFKGAVMNSQREAEVSHVEHFYASFAKSGLLEVIDQRRLTAVFQPIINMRSACIIGYEGLIRGPSDSPLHSPLNLFQAAAKYGLSGRVERLCREIVLESFVNLNLTGKIFLNVSPRCFIKKSFKEGDTARVMRRLGVSPDSVVIELTENQPALGYNLLREATLHYRELGFEVAIDDLGEGFSGLRLWSELRPDFVKIDKHFIQRINQDPVKLQFVRSIQHIAENSGSHVIAEGVETQPELMIIKDLGIEFAQGYYIARPSHIPAVSVSPEASRALTEGGISVYPQLTGLTQKTVSASRLSIEAPTVNPKTTNEEVYKIFCEAPALHAIPVVKQGLPVGLISRNQLIHLLSKPFSHELFGKKPCEKFMDSSPLIVDKGISVQELSRLIVASDRRYLVDGFIITDKERYSGIGTGHDLMREITEMQINAARYANPLTLLPGNVPINEHIDRLLQNNVHFIACYCDLDSFKPFNDRYGYRKGDDMIQLTGELLSQVCDPERDFLGHIGGDDFFILFQSPDWESRVRRALDSFSVAIAQFFDADDIAHGGYAGQDRRGQRVFHSLTTLSVGAVLISSEAFKSHYEVSAVAAETKKHAKSIAGNSLFINRRTYNNEFSSASGSNDESEPHLDNT